jgi:diguanylate cyclase (GGDEF)-like protein
MPIRPPKSLAIVVLLAVSVSAPAVDDCEELTDRARSIREMRDHDAAAGADRARTLIEEANSADMGCPSGRMLLHAALASNLLILGDNEPALEALRTALDFAERVDDPVALATVHRTAGVAYWEIGAHDRALENYLAALADSRAAGDVEGAARTAGNIGNLYNTLGEWESARRYHRMALEDFEESGWQQGIAGTLVNLGALAARVAEDLEAEGKLEQARAEYRSNLDYNRRALEIFEALDNPRGVAYAADNIARSLIALGRVDEALDYHARSLALRREVGDAAGVVNSLLTGASAYTEIGELERARELLAEAWQTAPRSKPVMRRGVAERQIELFERLGDFEAAFRKQQWLMSARDAEAEKEMAARLEELQQSFRAERLEKELALQKAQTEISDQNARRQQIISAASIIALVALLIILALLYSRYRLGRELSRSLAVTAVTDPLTGLLNRRGIDEQLRRVLDDSGRQGPWSVVLADIDRFKSINDRLGHQTGDRVLVQVADVIRQRIRGQDLAGRWGGEEFLILLPGTDVEGARAVAENIRQAVSQVPRGSDDEELDLTMTFGVTEVTAEDDLNALVRRVDAALYAGKRQGRDRVVVGGGRD